MLHPTAKSRLICVRRLFLDPFIKFFLKVLSTLLPTGINDMTISLGNHFRLCMTGVTLYGLDVATGQHQFVTDAAMSQTMKGHYRKSELQQLLFQQTGKVSSESGLPLEYRRIRSGRFRLTGFSVSFHSCNASST